MKNKNECKIIQNLLPNYIDNLTDTEINEYIENHLKECTDCQKQLNVMKKEIEKEIKTRENEKIDYMKKFKYKMRVLKVIILSIILVLIIAFSANTIRKMIIISDLSKKAEKFVNSNNFKCTTYIYDATDNSSIYFGKYETFLLEDKIKNETTLINEKGLKKVIYFGNNIELAGNAGNIRYTADARSYIEQNGKKIYIPEGHSISLTGPYNFFYTKNLWDLFKCSLKASIKETTFRGKKCYYINNLQTSITNAPYDNLYVNKETGLQLYVNTSDEHIYEEKYEFDIVTEDDFIEPDVSEYEKMTSIQYLNTY